MKPSQSGFTLIEIAIVLLIVTILLGYTVAMFPVQQELKQYRRVQVEIDSVIEHLIAFAQVNGRLPCPDTSADSDTVVNTVDGQEDRLGINACEAYFGFLPARTLGINGKYNAAGVLVDPWDSGYGYAISNFNAGSSGNSDIDLVTPNGIRDEGIFNVMPDLFICVDSDEAGSDLDCADAGSAGSAEVVGSNGEVAAVVISLGKDSNIPATSTIQAENLDNFHDGKLDKVYIFTPRRDDYDDVVRWISTNLLFSKMIEADQLP
jgi:prepilin-type N-terminal cleavage/methylation domain-containing protein